VNEDYCRAVESYLCRKNDGHLIRIVGPAFEAVCAWSERGVPLKVAYRGIDRYFERYYAKGPRRRPVRVEFCEADVLDVFDEWRRAVGVSTVRETAETSLDDNAVDEPAPHRGQLKAHLARVRARLGEVPGTPAIAAVVDDARRLTTELLDAGSLRGDARQSALDRLRTADVALVEAIRAQCDASTLQAVHEEADQELAPFRTRMEPDAYQRAQQQCFNRILRERFRLPVLTFE
jgi:hypothetical protein